MNVAPLVSVLVPAYQREATLARAVQSVLAEVELALEVIVVDDASADETARVAHALARADHRVTVLRHEQNRGAQAARNTGLRAATGEWIAFLDSDDEWLPGSLARRLDLARTERADWVHADCLVQRPEDAAPAAMGIAPLAGSIYAQLLRKPGPLFPSLLVRRGALRLIGGLDESIAAYQEWDTAIRLARLHVAAFDSRPAFIYHCHAGATISKEPLRGARGYEQVILKHAHAIRAVCGRAAMAQHWDTAAHLYALAQAREDARRCMLHALANRPLGRTALRRARFVAEEMYHEYVTSE
jgi:glycosyltransferase involved in cell wall biosynthesis